MSEINVSLSGSENDAEEIRAELAGIPFDEVEAHSMTGMEHDIAWIIGAALGSPVVVKLLDVLQKANAERKIKKVSISKDGRVIIEGAMPRDAAKLIRTIAESDKED
jgi:hypothetical protein